MLENRIGQGPTVPTLVDTVPATYDAPVRTVGIPHIALQRPFARQPNPKSPWETRKRAEHHPRNAAQPRLPALRCQGHTLHPEIHSHPIRCLSTLGNLRHLVPERQAPSPQIAQNESKTSKTRLNHLPRLLGDIFTGIGRFFEEVSGTKRGSPVLPTKRFS